MRPRRPQRPQRQSHHIARSIAAAAALCLGATAAVCAKEPAPTSQAGAALYQAFVMPPKLAWGAVTLSLEPGAWRVGGVDGPQATEAQLRAALGALAGVEIGARCAGWVEGSTTYPCGFAIRGLHAAGDARSPFSAMAMDLEPGSARARSATATPRADLVAAGLMAPVLDEPRFVAMQVPARVFTIEALRTSPALKFEFRALSNVLVPSEFDRSSSVVILRPAAAAPALAQRL